jgi:hypothetical protein
VINLLIEVKLTLQKMRLPSGEPIFQNIDACISKLTPIAHVYYHHNKTSFLDIERSQSWDDRREDNTPTTPNSSEIELDPTSLESKPYRLSL